MEFKKLSSEEQLALFDQPNAEEIVRQYVLHAKDFIFAAMRKSFKSDEENTDSLMDFLNGPGNEVMQQIYEVLTVEEAREIFRKHGIFTDEALVKMIEVFPKEVSKELLLGYCAVCCVGEPTLLKVVETYPKEDIREILITSKFMYNGVFKKILKIFSKPEIKDILLNIVERDGLLSNGTELEILGAFCRADAVEIFKAAIRNVSSLCDETQLVILDLFPKEASKAFFMFAAENGETFMDEVINEIIDKFSKKDARDILEKYFASEGAQEIYDEDEMDYFLSRVS